MGNAYSVDWFETFLPTDDPPPVDREVDFIRRHLPLPAYRRILDVACGIGRHAWALRELGYDVLGIDASEEALARARAQARHRSGGAAQGGPRFLLHDMRDLDALDARFDGVVCLWQSFGGFGDDQNAAALRGMRDRLRRGGRLLLDVYNADALSALPPESVETRAGREVTTTRSLSGDRFRVRISYAGSATGDEFEWQVFTPARLTGLASDCGLELVSGCAWYDDRVPPSPEHVRMQLLLERAGSGPDP